MDIFDYLIENIEKNNSDAKFFFPVGDRSKFSNNTSWKNNEYRRLISRIAGRYETGLNPSFNASQNYSLICTELTRLKTILAKDVITSRFDSIRLRFPDSYRDVKRAGITEDYSMGYPDEPGFRAGVARPFNFYDVMTDQVTDLRVFPFQFMDTALYQHKKLDITQSKDLILKLINETRKIGGLFISIWHNSSLIESEGWREGREVFEFMLKNQLQ